MLSMQGLGIRRLCSGSGIISSRQFPIVPQKQRSRDVLVQVDLNVNNLKNGLCIEVDDTPYIVREFLHVNPGKGAAFVRSKLQNLFKGGLVDKTFRAGEIVQEVEVERKQSIFSYADGDEYVFLDSESFEEYRVPKGDFADYMVENLPPVLVNFYKGEAFDVTLPQIIEAKVVECDPYIKGSRETPGTKNGTLESGYVMQVPSYLEQGTMIKINTQTRTYLGKVKE